MDLTVFEELLTPLGQTALAQAESLAPSEHSFLACFERLRKHYPAELAKAALETAIFRVKARPKFAQAASMYFTREALEQASGDLAAQRRARRFVPFGVVADLCCGIGGDTLALAQAGLTVHAIDSDPLRLAMARANAVARGVEEGVHLHAGDVLTVTLNHVRAAFADPSRRSGDRRHLDPAQYTPPLAAIRSRFPTDFPLAVKIAPGTPWETLADVEAEVEFVSVDGELKECVLWFGPLRSTSRRASILPSGETFCANESLPVRVIGQVQQYVFDPDPAVARAGLAANLAKEFGLCSLDFHVALLTGDELFNSSFLDAYRIEWSAKYHAGKLREFLRSQQVGRVTFIKRGSRLDSESIQKSLKLITGARHRTVILTRIGGDEMMLIGERMQACPGSNGLGTP